MFWVWKDIPASNSEEEANAGESEDFSDSTDDDSDLGMYDESDVSDLFEEHSVSEWGGGKQYSDEAMDELALFCRAK
jgi:hypothetical protein